jgi:hypothetical protein
VAGEGTITIPNNHRRNEQLTDVYQASLERVADEGRASDREVSCRRAFYPSNRLRIEMSLNTRSGSGALCKVWNRLPSLRPAIRSRNPQ